MNRAVSPILPLRDFRHNQSVETTELIPVLDREQLRGITMDDEPLMREILAALVEDTSRQIHLLAKAVQDGDANDCKRLAHYSKGACANVGAGRAAALLKQMERHAVNGDFAQCEVLLGRLNGELDLLRQERI